MKVTIVKEKEKKDYSLFHAILLLILGIILVFNSGGFISTIFTILGIIVTIFGIAKFVQYSQIKKQRKIEQPSILYMAIISITIGLLVIFLSNFLVNTIQIVTGIWLLFIGLNKINNALIWKTTNNQKFIAEIISSIILILLGIYTIFAQNVVFMIIGIILIIYAVIQFITYFKK